jgi:hypothetical protein
MPTGNARSAWGSSSRSGTRRSCSRSLRCSRRHQGLSGDVSNDSSTLHKVAGLIGPTVFGCFLFLIGIINLVILYGIVRVFLRMRLASSTSGSSRISSTTGAS